MQEKPFYTSKRFYFNALTIVLVVAQFFGFTSNEVLATQTTNILTSLAPIVNLLLAWVSKKPLGLGAFGDNQDV